MDAMGNQGVSKASLSVTKALLWVKVVARVFLPNIFCLLMVAMDNQGVSMALLRRC